MDNKIRVRITETRPALRVRLQQYGSGAQIEEYDGQYVVTPSGELQTLYCAQMKMRDDVNVLEIPYAEVGNPGGGRTATIG